MKRLLFLCSLIASVFAAPKAAPAQETTPVALTPVMVQDFEKTTASARVWVVNVPNESASVEVVSRQPFQGQKSLQLRYRLAQSGQYLGVAVPVKILAPIRHLHTMVNGDGSGCGFAVYFTDIRGETHKYRPATNSIDFKGWKPVDVDMNAPHEIWGGDKNLQIDYPIREITFEISHRGTASVDSALGFDAIRVDSEMGVLETLGAQVEVVSPAYGADVEGNTRISVSAPGFERLSVYSWKPGGAFGTNALVANVTLDKNGGGSFVYPAKSFPHGPNTVTITGEKGAYKDNCYLQIYNRGGVSWNEGMPKAPPGAQGMKLVFADDFDKPLSISNTDSKATYYSHKPPNGSQDFSTLPFSDFESARNPFFQVDSYLRIRADEKKNSSGLLSSLHNDASGIKASAPCYFECRLLGPNAIGTWPAFWLMTDYLSEVKKGTPENTVPVDELDIIEAYGGEGPGEPNAKGTYMIMPHAWNQGEAGKAAEKAAVEAVRNPASMKKFGVPSMWYETFHTYGCKITLTDTIYYCDDIEVARHKTLDASKRFPFFFMINLATGGGWPVDLSRYDGRADMYVDYVRVYVGK